MGEKIKLVLLYTEGQKYGKDLEALKNLLRRLEGGGVEAEAIDAKILCTAEVERLKSDIRNVPSQVRGKIVSSKGFILPFTRMKNLNLQNTPILVIYGPDGRIIDVYPHLCGTVYVGVEEALRKMIEMGSLNYFSIRGLLEEPLTKIVADDPSILEDGMRLISSQLQSSSGTVDLVLRDKRGTPVAVEVETTATDSAVGQICRLAAGFAKDNRLSPGEVRKIIVARRAEGLLNEAARGAGVEVYLLALRRVV